VLTKGYVTFVSPEDAGLLQTRKWHAKPRERIVYVEAGGSKGSVPAALHREILGAASEDTDHRDHDGLNNRRFAYAKARAAA
jgi:hypothetical protein